MFDQGTGPPLIVIPGVQGRWEWMTPALRELQKRCRTMSYSLCGDIGSGTRFDPELGFENYIRQLDAVFERDGRRAGGALRRLVRRLRRAALRGAAARARVARSILVSAPAPGWAPSERQRATRASVAVGPDVRADLAAAGVAGDSAPPTDTWPRASAVLRAARRARARGADGSAARWRRGCALAAEHRLRARLRPRQRADARRHRRGRARSASSRPTSRGGT